MTANIMTAIYLGFTLTTTPQRGLHGSTGHEHSPPDIQPCMPPALRTQPLPLADILGPAAH